MGSLKRNVALLAVLGLLVLPALGGCGDQTGSKADAQASQSSKSSNGVQQHVGQFQVDQGSCQSSCTANVNQQINASGAGAQSSGGKTSGGQSGNSGNQQQQQQTGVDVQVKGPSLLGK